MSYFIKSIKIRTKYKSSYFMFFIILIYKNKTANLFVRLSGKIYA